MLEFSCFFFFLLLDLINIWIEEIFGNFSALLTEFGNNIFFCFGFVVAYGRLNEFRVLRAELLI